jgi:SagB-type dehydrogenase family enzyme
VNKKNPILIIFIIIGLVLIVLTVFSLIKCKEGRITKVCFDNHCFDVELALKTEEQKRGLAFREDLDLDKGMLFIFEKEEKHSFWMKNALIPLDIIWINKNKEVVFISQDAQPCEKDPCSSIIPNKEAKYVLEINAGISKNIGLKIGDKISFNMQNKSYSFKENSSIILPQPKKDSETSIEEALLNRRSIREYKDEALTLEQVSQILWSAQGITAPQWGGRTAPSAGALYPLELYLVVRKVENLEPGVYQYLPQEHKLDKVLEGNVNLDLVKAGLNQMFISKAAVNLVISAVFSRTTGKYGERGIQYVHLEAGHAAQNVYLQVQSLDLGTVTVGAFHDEEIKKLLNLSEEETPLYIMPIGKI